MNTIAALLMALLALTPEPPQPPYTHYWGNTVDGVTYAPIECAAFGSTDTPEHMAETQARCDEYMATHMPPIAGLPWYEDGLTIDDVLHDLGLEPPASPDGPPALYPIGDTTPEAKTRTPGMAGPTSPFRWTFSHKAPALAQEPRGTS